MQIKKHYLLIITLITTLSIAENESTMTDYYQYLQQVSKPAPNPPGPVYTSMESMDNNQRRESGIDLITGYANSESFTEKPDYVPAVLPQMGTSLIYNAIPDEYENIDSPEGGPTPPVQLLGTTTFPWNTIYKLVMRFNVAGTDYFYHCSAWSAGNFHLVTAGHCIYNFDPNDDGDESDQKWADDVWAFPAQTDRVAPFDCGVGYCGDWPYGHAVATHLRSYTGWTDNHNYDHDWGVITLDRNMGQRTGWMGRDDVPGASLNFSGYPVETPFVPAGTVVQYKGYDSNNVISTTAFRIELSAFIYGGHSGGPSWKYIDGNRYVVGIHSTSDRVGTAHDTLLTSGKMSDINSYISTDETVRPPANMTDITEYLYDGTPHKSISKTLVGKGESMTIDYSILNGGFTGLTNDIVVFIMASTNELISTNDSWIGSDIRSEDISAYSFRNFTSDLTIPNSLPAGDYTLGILMSSTGEYGNELTCDGSPCTNKISIANQVLTVEDCPSDAYEDDDVIASATDLASGTSQNHSICATGDKDLMKVIIPSGDTADAVFETSGVTGDTYLSLYTSVGSLITSDNDSGQGLFSKIERKCGVNALNPGTYYLRVEEYLNNSTIDSYQIRSSVVQCGDLIFRDSFE